MCGQGLREKDGEVDYDTSGFECDTQSLPATKAFVTHGQCESGLWLSLGTKTPVSWVTVVCVNHPFVPKPKQTWTILLSDQKTDVFPVVVCDSTRHRQMMSSCWWGHQKTHHTNNVCHLFIWSCCYSYIYWLNYISRLHPGLSHLPLVSLLCVYVSTHLSKLRFIMWLNRD